MTVTSYEEWMKEQDALAVDIQSDKDELYERAKAGYEKFDGAKEVEILWRLARAAYKAAAAAEVKGDKSKQLKILLEGEEWSKRGLAVDDKNGDVHSWYAYLLGKISDHLGVKERIQTGKLVQTHLEAAIKYKPDEYALYYTYGRWCMEVAKLSWLERKIAATFFDKPPEATYADAVDKFKKVAELKPQWKANYYYMSKSYIQMKDYKDAIKCLDNGASCPITDEEDQVVNNMLLADQTKYASYR